MVDRGFLKYFPGHVIIALVIGLLASVPVLIHDKYVLKKSKHEFEYSSQLKTLDNVSDNLARLQTFVNDQKRNLVESEKAIKELKEEEKKIKPVIEADRKTIEAIFRLQSEVSARKLWLDRGISFILGVISSMLATLIIAVFKRKSLSTS